jgi:asparagine N-glycosylation enzyme membrane subunit Stt3
MSHQAKRTLFAWTLWLPVILAFLLVISAWTILIKVAGENPVETIKIDSKP